MSGYTQLTQEERYQIYILKKAEYSQAQIAGLLGRDKSTISRTPSASLTTLIVFSCVAGTLPPAQRCETNSARTPVANVRTVTSSIMTRRGQRRTECHCVLPNPSIAI